MHRLQIFIFGTNYRRFIVRTAITWFNSFGNNLCCLPLGGKGHLLLFLYWGAYIMNIQEKICEPACYTFVFMISILRGHTLPPLSGDLPPLVTPLKSGRDTFYIYSNIGMSWLLCEKIVVLASIDFVLWIFIPRDATCLHFGRPCSKMLHIQQGVGPC